MEREKATMKLVYVVVERNGRKFWNRIGVAFVNSDDTISVKLEAIPVNGEMVIRDYTPREGVPAPLVVQGFTSSEDVPFR